MVQTVQAQIVSVSRLNDTIWQYVLKPAHFVPYQAGQYLQIHWPEGQYYFSIANAPLATHHYELHVRHRLSPQVWTNHSELDISLPYGICDVSHLHPTKPILFLAVGTGFAPIRAIIQQLIGQNDVRLFDLHWRVAVAEDLYDPAFVKQVQTTKANCHYFPHVLPSNSSNLIPFIMEHYPNLKAWQIVMAGPFELMVAMQQELLEYGLNKDVIFSDAFEFAQS